MVLGSMDNIEKEYTNGDVIVKWRPHLCDHSAVCITKLSSVFDNTRRPWVNMQGAPTAEIIDVVNQCPTAALTWRYSSKTGAQTINELVSQATEIVLVENGPVRISGTLRITDEQGNVISEESRVSICRCGKSGRMPFCDGNHRK